MSEALRQNPNVMELEAINKWNGQLPQYMTQGANTPFITVTWDLRAPAPTPSHLRATVAIKGSFRGAEF